MTAHAGDTSALVARFERELGTYIRRRVPGAEADDVLQDALLRIHTGVGQLRAGERLTPWVFRVARSAVVDHQRRSGVRGRRFVPAEVAEEPMEAEGTAAESSEHVALLSACIEPFLSQLPTEQAEALRLVDMGGASQAEAARALGLPLATMKARVQRGRRRLRADLEACCALVQDRRGAVIEVTPRCGCGAG